MEVVWKLEIYYLISKLNIYLYKIYLLSTFQIEHNTNSKNKIILKLKKKQKNLKNVA